MFSSQNLITCFLIFCSTIPYLPFEFLIFYHSSLTATSKLCIKYVVNSYVYTLHSYSTWYYKLGLANTIAYYIIITMYQFKYM